MNEKWSGFNDIHCNYSVIICRNCNRTNVTLPDCVDDFITESLVKLEKSGQMVRVCHIQEDYRRVTDGTYIDSCGHFVSFGKLAIWYWLL